MRVLEKILEEIKSSSVYSETKYGYGAMCVPVGAIERILRNHMNDGWLPVEQKPKKDYIAVLAVDKHDYYFVAVYDKEHGFRSNDIGADVDNIVAYSLFNPYRLERREE